MQGLDNNKMDQIVVCAKSLQNKKSNLVVVVALEKEDAHMQCMQLGIKVFTWVWDTSVDP